MYLYTSTLSRRLSGAPRMPAHHLYHLFPVYAYLHYMCVHARPRTFFYYLSFLFPFINYVYTPHPTILRQNPYTTLYNVYAILLWVSTYLYSDAMFVVTVVPKTYVERVGYRKYILL